MLDNKHNSSTDNMQQASTQPEGWCSPEFSSGCLLDDDDGNK